MPVAGADKQGEMDGDAPSSGLRQASTEAGCHGKLPLDCSTDRSGGGGRWSSAGHGQGGGARGDSNSNRGFCRGSGERAIDGGNVSVVTMFGMAGVRFADRRRASIGRFNRFRCQSLAGSWGRQSRDHSGGRWASGRAVSGGRRGASRRHSQRAGVRGALRSGRRGRVRSSLKAREQMARGVGAGVELNRLASVVDVVMEIDQRA